MSHRPGLNLCSNVAHVQLGTSLVMMCIETSAYILPSEPLLTWNTFGTSASDTLFLVNAGTLSTGNQFAFVSMASVGKESVLPNAALRPEMRYRLLLTMKSNAALFRRASSPIAGFGGTDGRRPPPF